MALASRWGPPGVKLPVVPVSKKEKKKKMDDVGGQLLLLERVPERCWMCVVDRACAAATDATAISQLTEFLCDVCMTSPLEITTTGPPVGVCGTYLDVFCVPMAEQNVIFTLLNNHTR